jgi:hypothetical protein
MAPALVVLQDIGVMGWGFFFTPSPHPPIYLSGTALYP